MDTRQAPSAREGPGNSAVCEPSSAFAEWKIPRVDRPDHMCLVIRTRGFFQAAVHRVFGTATVGVRNVLGEYPRAVQRHAGRVTLGQFHLHGVVAGMADAVAATVGGVDCRELRE